MTLGDAAKLGGAALKVLVDRQGNSSSSTLKELRLYRCPRIGEAAIRVLATTTTSSSLKGLEKFAAVDCGGGQGGLLMHRRPLVPENEKQEEQENAEEGGGEDEMQLDTITTTATATTITAPPTTTSTTDNKENNAINDDDYTSNGKKLTDRTRHLKGEEEASDDAWIALISVIGPSLTELVIEGSYGKKQSKLDDDL